MRNFYYLTCILLLFPFSLLAQNYTSEQQNEIDQAQYLSTMGSLVQSQVFGGFEYGNDGINEDFIPTAGATETFNPAVGDHFYDTGGPGGSPYPSYDGPGDYVNCGCVTNSTLAGVSEIKFNDFSVFATFDWLKIYDGTNNTGTVLYDNSATGANSGDILLADMIASHGSDTFTSTSGNFFFEFNATTVVAYAGWDVEIITSSNGGGGGTEPCTHENPSNGFEDGTPNSLYGTANDLIVPADGTFTLEQVVANILVPAGSTITFADVYYYDNNGSNLPGTQLGSQMGMTPTSQTIIGTAFGMDVREVILDVTPFDFTAGSSDTTFWIRVHSPNSFGSASYWEATSASTVGNLTAGYDLSTSTWSYPSGWAGLDGVYQFNGTCSEDGDPPTGGDCSQDFDGTPDTGVGFSDGYIAANDITVAGNSSFTLQTITLEVAALSGEPSEFDLEIFSDNGTGGVGTSTGETVHFDSSNMTYVPNGLLFGVYPQFTVTLTVPDIELSADTADDERYWLAVASSLSTTNDWTYWVSYAYTTNPDSYATWQNDGVTWFEYGSGAPKEGVMTVQGICDDGGDPPGGDECEQGIPSQSEVPNAYNILTTSQFRSAEDFVVDADGFTLQTITIDTNQQGIPNEATILIRADVAGTPGEVLHTITGAPDDSEVVGSAFGDPIYHLTFELDTPIDLAEGTYWLDPKMSTATTGEVVWWAVADYDSSTHGAAIQQSTDNGTTWAENPAFSGIFTVSGICGGSEPGDGCEWTVSVFGSGFGDEVSWEFRDADGNVVLSGGPYLDIPFTDTQTITAQDPVEFYIETMGDWGDNTPSFTIENANGVVLSGTVAGGTEETYSDIMCSDTPPPPPAECEDHEVLDNGMENAYFFANRLAVDIPVGDAGFTVEGLYITIAVPIGTNASSFNFIFYDNNSGVPGTEVGTATGSIIGSDIIGQNFGRDFIQYNVDFDAGMALNANTTYWMEVQSDAEAWDWSSDSMGMIGYPGVIDNGGGWANADGGEFVYALYCEEMGAGDMNSFDFSYYPNPVKDVLNIESQKAIESIDAFNLAGQKVMSNMKLTDGKVNMSSLTPGTYVFRVTLKDGQVETFKIIKR